MTPLEILYEDEDLLAVNKPEGVLSHPNPGGKRGSCAFGGNYDMQDRRFDDRGRSLWLVHRLDKDTSGVLLAARSRDFSLQIRELFLRQDVIKSYAALVLGIPRVPEGDWYDFIDTRRGREQVRSRAAGGRKPNARLHYRSIEPFSQRRAALLSIDLYTGRTHQIRVQCASRGHPVLGDRIYGDFGANRIFRGEAGLTRLFLHASVVEFTHPRRGRPVRIEAALPKDLEQVLARLGRSRDQSLEPRGQ